MQGDLPCSYQGMRLQARSMAAIVADNERSRFVVGSVGLREDNEIHLIEYTEDNNEIICNRIYPHKNEVWHLAPSPSNPSHLITCDGTDTATLWSLGEMDADEEESSAITRNSSKPTRAADVQGVQCMLESVTFFGGHSVAAKSAAWDVTESDTIMTADDNTLRLWKLDAGEAKSTASLLVSNSFRLASLALDPHRFQMAAVGGGGVVKLCDFRANKIASSIDECHSGVVRDLEYNPNRPNILATVGDDAAIKVWDLRKTSHPLVSMVEHSHWIWRVAYNRSHDVLVMTCGSDAAVNLFCLPSPSSLTSNQNSSSEMSGDIGEDRLVTKHQNHNDSVYSIAWAAASSFTYASLSFDGVVFINHVPQNLKYTILL